MHYVAWASAVVVSINGNDHWKYYATGQGQKIDSCPEDQSPIASPVIQQKMEEPQTAAPPILVLICVAYWWLLADGFRNLFKWFSSDYCHSTTLASKLGFSV